VGIIGGISSNALRINAQCTWRRRTGLQTYTIPPSAARSARCAYAGASLQRSTAAPEAWHRSGPLARSGTTRWRARDEQQPNRLTMPRDALPTRLASFCLLAMASPPRDTRRDPWISQQTSGIVSGANSKCIAGALAPFLLTAGRVARRSSPRQSRRPGREDGGILPQPDHIERPPLGLTVRSSTPTMAPVIACPVVHGRGLPQGAETRHEIRPLYPGLMD
jgi:hypothetical protein